MREFFPESRFNHIDWPVLRQLNDSAIKPRVVVYNVENAGEDGKYQPLRDHLTATKTTILVHTSDEFQGSGRKWKYGEGVEVYNMVIQYALLVFLHHYHHNHDIMQVPLVLRQYGIYPYRSYATTYPNVMQIPLGYMKGMLDEGNVSLDSVDVARYSLSKRAASREYNWSFVGGVAGHKERHYAIATFSTWDKHLQDAGLSPPQMRGIYNNSKFVLVGRGQVNLDCFRIYEAIIAGAVPVVVGSKWERERTFEFEGDLPPFLFADSYPEALETCRSMADEEVDKLREANVKWYIERVLRIRRRIDLFLTVYPPP